ncbi:MAG TPA: ACT domain-containing protein [Deltaproteobacteria bacterium]|nr:ACT domain-containing protein [Deltaproteobacteria bacterium]HOM29670.1 ACT domain-containing protein [Deltaproteobacteria bacterium]HPP81122.1 ACT domain-containing protein [Deltaproteobacteria bacterium]
MTAYQLTVPVENRPGRLAQVSGVLAREKINIRAITISSFGDKGFFNILVDDPKLALKALKKEGIEAELKEIIAVLIDDKPGGMDSLAQILARQGINIENAYGFVLESNKTAVFVIDVSDLEGTQRILRDHGFKTLSPEALAAIEPFHYMRY